VQSSGHDGVGMAVSDCMMQLLLQLLRGNARMAETAIRKARKKRYWIKELVSVHGLENKNFKPFDSKKKSQINKKGKTREPM